MQTSFLTGRMQIGSLEIPVVSTKWNSYDHWNTLKVRWNIRRMNYTVEPGIYAVGSPDKDSRVFVTANYKLSFDHLRRALDGISAWILVLNTRGINVWCAAGKKTFGTKELVNRIRKHRLEEIVSHRTLIIPQLGATGIAAHVVREETGFSVIYGPIRATDIKAFLDSGLKATKEMRTITFPFRERIKLVPVDIFYGKYFLLLIPALFFILSGLCREGYSLDHAVSDGSRAIINLFSGYLAGCALTPALLPWIPFRRFSLKGLAVGLVIAIFLCISGLLGKNIIENISWFLMVGGISSFMAMNFTGSSTFTSISGVRKEMKSAVPLQITIVSMGLIGWIISKFISL